ncbi:MAG: carbon storage regulator [Phycisphaerales bacterium]|nr:carbon storage regulator [Phycisphaerales bacterium]
MLVFTRREGEEIVIGDPKNPLGVVRVASIRGDRVRIAFDFPRDVQVNRREVANQIVGEEPPSSTPHLAQANGTAGITPGVTPNGDARPPHVARPAAPAHAQNVVIKRDVIGSIKPKPPMNT